MRRKYNFENKINFVIVGVLSLLIIIVFSLFIIKYNNIQKVSYTLDKGSIVYDYDKNKISIDSSREMKLKWNGNYYLVGDTETILGRKVVVYNEYTKDISLYGKFYEIASDGEVNITDDVININGTSDSKFYKLEDRKYLLVDKSIKSMDGALDTSNYLIVELDKQGNALLLNDEVHYKTLSEVVINTSSYSFDIANEILKINDLSIDLKEIIGSSNQYKPSSKSSSEGGNSISNNISNTTTNNGNNDNVATGDNNVVNNSETGDKVIEDVIIKTKKTSVISILPSVSSISVDYIVYDPANEYNSVYVEVDDNDKTNTIYLSKSSTNIIINDLDINTKYHLKFMYSYFNENKEIVYDSFGEYDVYTSIPSYEVSLVKISKINNELSYKVSLDSRYVIDKLNISLIIDDEVIDNKDVNVAINEGVNYSSITDTIGIPNINKGSKVIIKLNSVSYGDKVIEVNSYYQYINE